MTKKRVVITGLGIVSCFGTNVNSFYQQLLQGKSGIRSIEEFDCTGLATKFAGTVQNFDSTDYIEKKQARRIDKFIAYATVAGKKALEMANFSSDAPTVDLKKCGIIIGSGMGGMSVFADGVKTLAEKGASRVTPFFVPYILTNMAGGLLATDLGFMGPNYSISTACATANYSIITQDELNFYCRYSGRRRDATN